MKRRTTVKIYGMEFTLVGEESEEYVQKIASLIDKRMRETAGAGISTVASAVLAAANIADDYYKSLETADAFKAQLREYFEEISRLKDENETLRRAVRRTDEPEQLSSEAQAAEQETERESAAEKPAERPAEEYPPRPRRGRPRTRRNAGQRTGDAPANTDAQVSIDVPADGADGTSGADGADGTDGTEARE